MKKIILAALLMGSMQPLFAQSIKLGIKGGLNAANTDRGDVFAGNSSSYRLGFNAGVFADFECNKWSVEPGLFYTVKGANYKSSFVSTTPLNGTEVVSAKGHQTFNYLELPVNVIYNIQTKPGKIFVGAGPYLGYLLSGKAKSTITKGSEVSSDYDQNLAIGSGGDFKRTDFGLNALAGITFKNGLLASIGYGYGLTSIVNNASSVKLKNRVMNISVGYSFL